MARYLSIVNMKMRSSLSELSRCLAALAMGLPLAAAGQAMEPLAVPVCANQRCGVIDQDGKLLLPFDNAYSILYSNRPGNSVFAAAPKARDGVWRLLGADGKPLLKSGFKQLRFLTPGYYGVSKGSKFGIIDEQGNEIQPQRFDEVYEIGESNTRFIGYEIRGKQGILSAKGEKITEAVYEDMERPVGQLVLAQRQGQRWMINLETRTEQPVAFDSLQKPGADGVMIAQDTTKQSYGLVDAQGKELIPQSGDYRLIMGSAAQGYVAFQKDHGAPCGYMDYSGKVVIQAQFAECGAFGKLGAMVQALGTEDKKGQFGLLGRQGQWLQSPRYDSAEKAGLGLLGQAYLHEVPGYSAVGRLKDPLTARYGIFSTDDGKEVFAPKHLLVGVLTPDLFVYSDEKAPKVRVNFMGSVEEMAAVGLMDRGGKSLVKPDRMMGFSLDPSGRFVLGHEGISVDAKVGLFDLQGKPLIGPEWQKIEIDPTRGYITGHEVFLDADNQQQSNLRALYDLTGRAVFTVKNLDCGAEQVVDGAGRPIWPIDPAPYCPKKQKKK